MRDTRPTASADRLVHMKLELRGITKRFGSLVANDHIDLVVSPGEIHCLLGENGAGKSTLMNVLYGLYTADEGTILLDDQVQNFRGPGDAMRAGIGMVHQHFMLVPVLTVAENVVLGQEIVRVPQSCWSGPRYARKKTRTKPGCKRRQKRWKPRSVHRRKAGYCVPLLRRANYPRQFGGGLCIANEPCAAPGRSTSDNVFTEGKRHGACCATLSSHRGRTG